MFSLLKKIRNYDCGPWLLYIFGRGIKTIFIQNILHKNIDLKIAKQVIPLFLRGMVPLHFFASNISEHSW